MDVEKIGIATGLLRVRRTILFADLVESCRLSEADEEGTAVRWRGLRVAIETHIVPAHEGRLIRTEGDGLLIVFESILPAVQCAPASSQSPLPLKWNDHSPRSWRLIPV